MKKEYRYKIWDEDYGLPLDKGKGSIEEIRKKLTELERIKLGDKR